MLVKTFALICLVFALPFANVQATSRADLPTEIAPLHTWKPIFAMPCLVANTTGVVAQNDLQLYEMNSATSHRGLEIHTLNGESYLVVYRYSVKKHPGYMTKEASFYVRGETGWAKHGMPKGDHPRADMERVVQAEYLEARGFTAEDVKTCVRQKK